MHCWVYLEFQFFGMGCLRQKPVLLKSYQKLFPSVSSEPLKVPWCFICQTKSPHVEFTWLKGYCIPSTFTENIPDQSCISNRWTPCRRPQDRGRSIQDNGNITPSCLPWRNILEPGTKWEKFSSNIFCRRFMQPLREKYVPLNLTKSLPNQRK